jgi:hypothetical protein
MAVNYANALADEIDFFRFGFHPKRREFSKSNKFECGVSFFRKRHSILRLYFDCVVL